MLVTEIGESTNTFNREWIRGEWCTNKAKARHSAADAFLQHIRKLKGAVSTHGTAVFNAEGSGPATANAAIQKKSRVNIPVKVATPVYKLLWYRSL